MFSSSPTTRRRDRAAGFTLIELLAVALVGSLLLLSFTSFYVSQQRAIRRNEIEIETSQALRTALEQMSRDLRLVGRDLTRAGFARFNTAAASDIDFNIDSNDDGTSERKEYRLNGTTIESCAGGGASCVVLADFASSLAFGYADCGANALSSVPLSSSDRNKVGRVDITLTLDRGTVAGTRITRTEKTSITMRNLCN